MPKVGTAYVSIRAKLDKLEKDLRDGHAKTTKSAQATQNAVSKIFKSTVGLFGLTIGFRALIHGFESLLEKSNEQAVAEKKLETVLNATGHAAGYTSAEMIKYAQDLQKVTTYGDELTISAEAILASFRNIRGMEFKRTIAAAQDLSTVMGVDLKSSVVQLAKALNDPISQLGQLGRAGIQFSDQQKQLIKTLVQTGDYARAQGIILTEIEHEYGGTSRAIRGEFIPSLKGAANAFGDLVEKAGDYITKSPTLISWIKKTEDAFVSLGDIIKKDDLAAQLAEQQNLLIKYQNQLNERLAREQETIEDRKKRQLAESEAFKDRYRNRARQRTAEAIELLEKEDNARAAFFTNPSGDPRNYEQRMIEAIQNNIDNIKAAMEKAKKEVNGAQQDIIDSLHIPTAADWKLFNTDSLETQKDQLETALDEIQADLDKFGGSIPTADDWELFYNDDLAEQKDALSTALDEIEKDVDDLAAKNKKAADEMRSAFSGWASGFSSDLADAVLGAEFSFDKILQSFEKMLLQMVIQKQIFEPLLQWGFSSSSASASSGSVAHSGGTFGSTSFPTRTVPSSLFYNAPRLHNGLSADEYPAILQRGETVLKKGESGGTIIVNITNNNNSEIETQSRQTPRGLELDVVVDNLVSKKLGQFGSASNRALRQMGAQQPLVVR